MLHFEHMYLEDLTFSVSVETFSVSIETLSVNKGTLSVFCGTFITTSLLHDLSSLFLLQGYFLDW